MIHMPYCFVSLFFFDFIWYVKGFFVTLHHQKTTQQIKTYGNKEKRHLCSRILGGG